MSGKDAYFTAIEQLPKAEVDRANAEYRNNPPSFPFPFVGRRPIRQFWTHDFPYIIIDKKPGSGEDTAAGVFIGKSEACANCKLVVPQGISSSAVTLKRFLGNAVVSKLFIVPNIPFNLSFRGGQSTATQISVPTMALYHPCPIRIENVQYDAVLSLGDIAEDSIPELKSLYKAGGRKTIILIPIQVKSGGADNAASDSFFQKIVAQLPGILQPTGADDKKKYEDITATTGNDFSLSKLIKTTPDPGGPVAQGGYFVWTGTPDLELFVRGYDYKLGDRWGLNEALRESRVEHLGTHYGWRPKKGSTSESGPIYIMMKNPVGVTATTMDLIKQLPMTSPDQATHPIILSSLVYKPGPPGSDVVGCGPTPSPSASLMSMIGGTQEGFIGGKCDPFNNFPNSIDPDEKRIKTQETIWKIVGGIGMFFATILTIWLAFKFVQSPYGKNLFGKLAEKMSDAFAKVKNVPSMFGKDEPPAISGATTPQQRAVLSAKKSTPSALQGRRPILPTDAVLNTYVEADSLIRQRNKVNDLYNKAAMARLAFDAAKKANAPNADQKQDIFKNTRAQYIKEDYELKQMIQKATKKVTPTQEKEAKDIIRREIMDQYKSPQAPRRRASTTEEQESKLSDEEIKEIEAAQTKAPKKIRKIKIEEPDEEEEKKSAAQIAKEAADIATEFLEKSKVVKEEIKDQKAEIKKIRTDFTKSKEPVPAMKLNELRKVGNEVEKVEEQVKETMSEEDKEKAARDLAAARKGLTFTQNRLNTLRSSIRKGGKTTRRNRH